MQISSTLFVANPVNNENFFLTGVKSVEPHLGHLGTLTGVSVFGIFMSPLNSFGNLLCPLIKKQNPLMILNLNMF